MPWNDRHWLVTAGSRLLGRAPPDNLGRTSGSALAICSKFNKASAHYYITYSSEEKSVRGHSDLIPFWLWCHQPISPKSNYRLTWMKLRDPMGFDLGGIYCNTNADEWVYVHTTLRQHCDSDLVVADLKKCTSTLRLRRRVWYFWWINLHTS